MNEFIDGNVVICDTGQAGSICQISGRDIWVLLRNGDIWIGQTNRVRFPQDQADLDAAPVDVDRLETKRSVRED